MQTEEERRIQGAKELEKNELFRRKIKIYGKRNWLTIPEDRKDQLRSRFTDINKLLKGTTDHFSNIKNVAQVQSRVLRTLKPVEDTLNSCLIAASNTQELHFCVDVALRNIDDKLPRIKEILREY